MDEQVNQRKVNAVILCQKLNSTSVLENDKEGVKRVAVKKGRLTVVKKGRRFFVIKGRTI